MKSDRTQQMEPILGVLSIDTGGEGGSLLTSLPNSLKHLSRLREATSEGREGSLTLRLTEDRVDTRGLAFPLPKDLVNEGGIRP